MDQIKENLFAYCIGAVLLVEALCFYLFVMSPQAEIKADTKKLEGEINAMNSLGGNSNYVPNSSYSSMFSAIRAQKLRDYLGALDYLASKNVPLISKGENYSQNVNWKEGESVNFPELFNNSALVSNYLSQNYTKFYDATNAYFKIPGTKVDVIESFQDELKKLQAGGVKGEPSTTDAWNELDLWDLLRRFYIKARVLSLLSEAKEAGDLGVLNTLRISYLTTAELKDMKEWEEIPVELELDLPPERIKALTERLAGLAGEFAYVLRGVEMKVIQKREQEYHQLIKFKEFDPTWTAEDLEKIRELPKEKRLETVTKLFKSLLLRNPETKPENADLEKEIRDKFKTAPLVRAKISFVIFHFSPNLLFPEAIPEGGVDLLPAVPGIKTRQERMADNRNLPEPSYPLN